MFRWSLISISAPGRIVSTMLAAALVCTRIVDAFGEALPARAEDHRDLRAALGGEIAESGDGFFDAHRFGRRLNCFTGLARLAICQTPMRCERFAIV